MQFARNTWPLWKNTLLLVTALSLSSCAGASKISNVRFYAEIPFVDCPEGVYVESLTKKSGLISCEEWKTKRPLMLMIDPDGKKEIFNQWSRACRLGGKKCNVEMESVKDTIETIDAIAGKLINKP